MPLVFLISSVELSLYIWLVCFISVHLSVRTGAQTEVPVGDSQHHCPQCSDQHLTPGVSWKAEKPLRPVLHLLFLLLRRTVCFQNQLGGKVSRSICALMAMALNRDSVVRATFRKRRWGLLLNVEPWMYCNVILIYKPRQKKKNKIKLTCSQNTITEASYVLAFV